MFDTGIKVPERQVRFNVNLKHLRLTKFYHLISVHDNLKPGPEVVKLFFMLNSVEHEILNAHKYKNMKKFGIF